MTEEEELVARRREAGEIWEKQDAEDLRAILATSGGRRFIWKMLEICGVYSDCFRGEETHAMARAAGKQVIGLQLLEKVFTADPNAYTLMRNEASDRARAQENFVNG